MNQVDGGYLPKLLIDFIKAKYCYNSIQSGAHCKWNKMAHSYCHYCG